MSSEMEKRMKEKTCIANIKARIIRFSRASAPPSSAAPPTARAPHAAPQAQGPINRLPPELLDKVLGNLSPADQLTACKVCRAWTRSVHAVVAANPHFSGPVRCFPIEYAQLVAGVVAPPQPSAAELREYAQDLVRCLPGGYLEAQHQVAYFSQAKGQTWGSKNAYIAIYGRLQGGVFDAYAGVRPWEEPQKWLDFSQFGVNPWVGMLFGERFALKGGKLSITLAPDLTPAEAVLQTAHVPANVVQSIKGMHLTQPPVKTIGLYAMDQERGLKLVHRLTAPRGIRLGDLIHAMREHAPSLLKMWKRSLDRTRIYVGCRGLHYFHSHEKPGNDPYRRFNVAPLSPVFYVALDNENLADWAEVAVNQWHLPIPRGGHYTRTEYMYSGVDFGMLKDWDAYVVEHSGGCGAFDQLDWPIRRSFSIPQKSCGRCGYGNKCIHCWVCDEECSIHCRVCGLAGCSAVGGGQEHSG